MKQKTIKKDLIFNGFGVHSGKISKLILKPAEIDSGINFFSSGETINLDLSNLSDGILCTTVAKNNTSISTVEHILSAINGLDISNIEIHVEGMEIPILDGCTNEFTKSLYPFLSNQRKDVKEFNLGQTVIYRSNDKMIIAIPSHSLEINYMIDYGQKLPNFMYYNYIHSSEIYMSEISKARTFGYLNDLENLRKNNLAFGSSFENSLVIAENSYLNQLNYYNEPVRHKILDFMGDLTFLNKKLNAKVFAYKTGHKEHLEFVKMLLNLKN